MGFLFTRYRHFRNLRDGELEVRAPEVFLVGENGQGKTNFLESIYLLCYGGSFRTHVDRRLITEHQEAGWVSGSFQVAQLVTREISVTLERQGKKEIRVDDRLVRDRLDLVENVPCILFSPEDLSIVTGSPEVGRRFFNQTMGLFEPLFIALLRSYRKLLRSRNLLLKGRDSGLLEAYSRNLVEVGLSIQRRRAAVVQEFNESFGPLFTAISALEHPATLEYRSSWKRGSTAEQVLEHLAHTRGRDLASEATTSGPHRDRFVLMQRGRELLHFASTGQIRLCSLILRVAQASYFHLKTGRKPVLLLDDVLLELDSTRKERFLAHLPPYEQAFFTFLPDEQYLRFRSPDTMVYRVVEGGFSLEESR
jgi:DNA replication and repair protein RecF